MNLRYPINLLLFFILLAPKAWAQESYPLETPKQKIEYKNKEYISSIRSVELHPLEKEGDFPVVRLGAGDQLLLRFDDLRADFRDVYVSLEYCDADWTPSRVSSMDYADGYNEDKIMEVQSSRSTKKGYTHYEITFPNEYIAPKYAGNYILKVYEDGDTDKLLLTRKFYVLKDIIAVKGSVHPSPNVADRSSHQKIDLTLSTGSITIQNPIRDLNIQVYQNKREDAMLQAEQPSKISSNEISYALPHSLDFKGNNEFLFADLRSFRTGSNQVEKIVESPKKQFHLFSDEVRVGQKYASTFDENGNFFIRNLDYNDDHLEGDYAEVYFSLLANPDIKGSIHVVGAFNNFAATDDNKMKYNPDKKRWEVALLLKQGLYDYDYILKKEDGKIETDSFSGSYFETGNDYQILVYHRRPGTYWDELIGFKEIEIHNKN